MYGTLPERIFICGFMGAGKTTAGKRLAAELKLPFHDLDAYIERQENRSITQIFEGGEACFRKKEKQAVLDLIRHEEGVVSLGGGTLHNQHMLDHIKVNGLLIFIDTPIEVIIDRIMSRAHRPLLMDENGNMKERLLLKKELSALYKQRCSFYEQAEITLYTAEYSSLQEMVSQMVKKIKYHVALY